MRVSLGEIDVRAATGERAKVLQLAKAISQGNWGLVARVCRGTSQGPAGGGWTLAGLMALRLWLADVLSDTTTHYSVEERFNLDRLIPRRHLQEAWQVSLLDASPTTVVALVALTLMGQ